MAIPDSLIVRRIRRSARVTFRVERLCLTRNRQVPIRQFSMSDYLPGVGLILLACVSYHGPGRTSLLAFSEEEADRKTGLSHALGVLQRAEEPLPGGGN
jgi:hypothetical protein